MKKSCFNALALYLLASAAVGILVYRRYPIGSGAMISALAGGLIASIGLGYLIAIPRKFGETMMIRRALAGEPPRDDVKVAAIGRISPSGSALVSPISKTSCVAYKYEMRSTGENTVALYSGFGLNPSAIQSNQGTIRLLAYPDLKVPPQFVQSIDAARNAREYVAATTFREPKLGNIKEMWAEMMKDFLDDDGTIRTDQRSPGADTADIGSARFIEWLIKPGDEICAIGRYSAQRGGLVPDPASPLEQVVITQGAPEGHTGRAIRSAIAYLIGGVIFLGVVVAGLAGLYANVPLEAAEQMAPAMTPTWPEIRLERLVERRLRVPLRKAGILNNSGTVSLSMPLGSAQGRLRTADGQEVSLARAEAVGAVDNMSTIAIDGNAVELAIDGKSQPLWLRIRGVEVPLADAEVQIIENNSQEVMGRLTYLPAGGSGIACRVAFRAARRT
jgi:hypothetical protein